MVDQLPQAGEFRPQLDSLRAFAVTGVVISHTLPEYMILQYVLPGYRGVQLFFVLSGFLISGILFDAIKLQGAAAFRPFFARRILRLMPLFYLVLAISTVVAWEDLKHSWPYHALYLSNFHFIFTGSWERLTAHFWTLAVEEQFYIFWPILLVILPTRYWPVGIGALFVIGLGTRGFIEFNGLWKDSFGIGLYPTYYADDFGGGAAAALWLRSNPSVRAVRRMAFGLSVIGGLVLVLLYFFLDRLHAVNSTLDVTAWMMVSVGLVLSCYLGINGLVGRILESWPLSMLGKISYGVYVWHLLAILITKKLGTFFGVYLVLGRFGWTATFIGTFIISVVLAGLSWHFFEVRMLALKSRFPYRSVPNN